MDGGIAGVESRDEGGVRVAALDLWGGEGEVVKVFARLDVEIWGERRWIRYAS